MKLRKKLLIGSLALGLSACAGDPIAPPPSGDDLFGLDDSNAYAGNLAASREAESDAKFDQTLPETFDLLATQSPIKSQGRRGVCSIFGTTALMEHLYISEGTIGDPDFSEQFLQWSAKFEVGSFPNSGGSNSSSNLRALNQYGTVVEADWPYEPAGWGPSDDPECDGEEDEQPTRCHTNGTPPDSALAAQRYRLPRGRWLNNSVESIKGHMFNTNTAVQAGGDFFYQSWGHGGTELGRYAPYREQGYILAPSAEDVADSRMRPAGHSFLLVGWDDNLTVQEIDAEGNQLDSTQTGFFLVKNSWGDGWATENPMGAGYGWISYEYVEDYLSTYVSGIPEVELVESCSDERDNDNDGLVDCADTDCADDRGCVDPAGSYVNDTPVDIPDNNEDGASSNIVVAEGGTISGLSVHVDIEHTYRGDLRVSLEKDGRSVSLVSNEGGGEDDLVRTFDVGDFDGSDAAGTWTLRVIDSAGQDTGRIRSWGLDITRCAGGDCTTMPEVSSYTNDSLFVIPDNDPAGVASEIEVADAGEISAVRVTVNITHDFPGDLRIAVAKDGTEVELVEAPDVSDSAFMQTFTVSDFNGEDSAGTWTLLVSDGAPRDEGTLNAWTLEITR